MTTLSRMRSQISSTETFPNGLIVTSGNVGIGTSNPANMLDIVGQYAAQFSGYQVFTTWRDTNDANKGFRIQTAGGNTLFSTDATGGGTYTERMRITSSGELMIGTAALAGWGKLSVSGSSADTTSYYNATARLTIQQQNTTVNNFSSISFQNAGLSDVAAIWAINQNHGQPTAGGALVFGTTTSGISATERMRITSAGNVGIGTSNPTATLSVYNPTASPADTYIDKPVNSLNGSLILRGGPSNSTSGMFIARDSGAGGTFNPQGIEIYAGGGERMRITSSGNVGIGTQSPNSKLDVAGSFSASANSNIIGSGDLYFTIYSTTASGNLVIDSASGYNSTIYIKHAGVNKWFVINNNSNSRYQILDSDYNDGVYIAQNTTSWTSNSDSRLKDVQGTITDSLDKVQQLTGVKFKWKREADNPNAKVRVGLIAQDVQAVLPEAVDDDSPDLITDEETGKVSGGLGVRYTEVVPLLVNAIKELKAEINELRAQVQGA